MGYRDALEATDETVQDINLAAERRLDEAMTLLTGNRYHTAIYVGGLSAEMFLKTACFMIGGANLTDPVAALMARLKDKKYKPPFKGDWEGGHGLWFWSQELLARRRGQAKKTPNRFMQVLAALYGDWFVAMRYRPGFATRDESAAFLFNVEWLAKNHTSLRR